MEILTPTSAIAAAVIVLLSMVYYFVKNRNILPGPRGLPYFGLYFSLKDETCHLQLQEIGKKYGDLYSFTFVGNRFINLGSAKAIREVHVNKSDCFEGRFTDFSILTYLLQDGVSMVNGEAWKCLRKFFTQSFREHGFNVMKDNTTGPLYDALAHTIEVLRTKEGDPFNILDDLLTGCMVSMRKVIFTEDAVTNEDLIKINEHYAYSTEGMTGVNFLLIGPFGRFLFSLSPALKNALAQHKLMGDLLRKAVRKVESSMDESHPTCVVEQYFKERNSRKQKNDPSWRYFSDKALVASLGQIVGDGILGVSCFIGFFLSALINHPEEQDKIYKEVMEVVGPNRLPTIEDRSKLPYTIAFMNEVVRTSNIFSLFPSLECSKETTVRGYRIPKGSITLLNIWQANHDPETYENPEIFNPDRYMSSPGKPKAELPVNFGFGKRACIGESFVMTQSFLFLASIVKHFTVSEPENPKYKSDVALMAGKLDVCIKTRTEKVTGNIS